MRETAAEAPPGAEPPVRAPAAAPAGRRRRPGGGWRFAALAAFLLASLFALSDATRNPARFAESYTLLIALTAVGLAVLSVLLVRDSVQLAREVRAERPGARLTVRMMGVFGLLAGVPVLVIYLFSVQFLHRSVDSWLDVSIERALERALELSRASLNRDMRERLKQVELLAVRLSDLPEPEAISQLHDTQEMLGASELTFSSSNGRVLAAGSTAIPLVPAAPDEAMLLQLRQGGTYIDLEPPAKPTRMRVVVNVAAPAPGERPRFVQALFPVGGEANELAAGVSSAFEHYRGLIYLRGPLKTSLMLTLSLVLMVSLLTAVWAAVFAARRLTAPLRGMAEMTRSVAAGDYEGRLPVEGPDEVGFLVDSFNDMTRRLGAARDDARESHRRLEEQRTYLEAVLSRLSSGVLTISGEGRLVTFNRMAEDILEMPSEELAGAAFDALARRHPRLGPFTGALARRLSAARPDWREEVELRGRGGRRVLMCRGTVLSGFERSGRPGHVIVFDDVTALVEAQRGKAWEEVARRLAHEIKNPLTPIQLSAERLRHKYLAHMEPGEAEPLDRLTRVIVQQVESLKEMVNAFSRYSRMPPRRARPVALDELVRDVAELYRDEEGRALVALRPAGRLPPAEADPGQLHQVLHNLIRNAREALANREAGGAPARSADAGPDADPGISIETREGSEGGSGYVEIRVSDRGAGIPEAIRDQMFEPYATTKPRGTGIGLAIVRKIVEEHEGSIWAEDRSGGGTSVVVRLPAAAADPEPAAAAPSGPRRAAGGAGGG